MPKDPTLNSLGALVDELAGGHGTEVWWLKPDEFLVLATTTVGLDLPGVKLVTGLYTLKLMQCLISIERSLGVPWSTIFERLKTEGPLNPPLAIYVQPVLDKWVLGKSCIPQLLDTVKSVYKPQGT